MEDEADELRDGAAASEPANCGNPNHQELTTNNKPSKAREEGELSSDDNDDDVNDVVDNDDDENNVCSTSQCTSTDAPPVGSDPVPPTNNCTQEIQAGMAVSGINLVNSVDIQSQSSIQSVVQKCIEKNQIPPKTATSGWCTPSEATDNLVIRFSDDESGSGSEECIKEKALRTKGKTTRLGGVQKPPVSSYAKLNKQISTSVNKVMPKKLSFNRPFVASTTKTHGTNFRGAGPSSVEQGYRIGRFNSLNKYSRSQEHGNDKGVCLNNSKLQDLRQQIALRESELKLRSVQRSKEVASCRDNDALTMKHATYGESVQLEPKEPDKKRAKPSGTYMNQRNSVGLQDISRKSTLPSKEPVMEDNSLQGAIKSDHGLKKISVGRTESSMVKWDKHNDKHVAHISENTSLGVKDAANVNTKGIQSDNSKQMDPSVMLHPVTSLANVNSNDFTKNLDSLELSHPGKINKHKEPSSFLTKSAPGKSSMRSGNDDILSGEKIQKSTFNNRCQASLNNESLWNCLPNESVPGHNNVNVQSLVEMEESLDKDLDDAQEHRRRCEIEERNAFKTYRKAQRALAEANARCSDLYRKRELYSARLRSFIMDNSGLFYSSRQNEQVGNELGCLNDMSNDVIPTSNHHLQPEYHGSNPLGFNSNAQCLNRHVNGQHLGSEPCSEPDVSTSELLPHRDNTAAHGVCSPSNDPNISADEDEETFPFEHESVQPNLECHRKEKSSEDEQKGKNNESSRKLVIDGSQDSLILEATLRSELFARLGRKNVSRDSGSCYNMESAVEQGAENDVRSNINQTRIECSPLSEIERSQQSDHAGTERQERSSTEAHGEMQNDCCTINSLNSHSTVNSEDNRYSNREGHSSLISEAFSPPNVLRSTFGHMKIIFPANLMELQARNQQIHSSDIYHKEGACLNSKEVLWNNTKKDSIHETIGELCGREMGSYTSNVAVDSFWPLCMYELRGKCNNDECPWQHVKDYCDTILYQNQHDDSDTTDYLIGLTVNEKTCNAARSIPKCHDVMTSPLYLVGLDILKADLHLYESGLAWRNGHCWQKYFSLSLALSNWFQKDLRADGPFSNGSDGRIEVNGSWNRKLSYLLSDDRMGLADNDQVLEMAILIFNEEVDKLEGMKKALPVLSRALEADSASVILWILYLLIYYSNMKSVGKDDMFSYAVTNNEGSYELWLMYINSRIKLDERLDAYEAALSALCRHASNLDRINASACILDLFLQMMDFLCMSGNFGKAIQKISGLAYHDMNSDESPTLLLSDIVTCLTLSDQCIFWISCMYLVVYRKLPDAVVQQFECEKQFVDIEWPSIHLIDNEIQRAIKLLETGLYSVDGHMKTEALESDNLRSLHFLAINHIRCMAALDRSECCRNLLDKYLGLYPSCLELELISARVQKQDCGDRNFVGFEETLSNWPKHVPGIQCIWNQYAEYVIQNGKYDIAKELMDRWFNTSWKVCCLQNTKLGDMDGLQGSAAASILDNLNSNLSQLDVMFGYLNLSIHKLLQNDRPGAHLAVDKALKAAVPEYKKFCMREQAMFLLTDESLLRENAPISYVLNTLKRYIIDAQALPVSEPLPRKFINNIKKTRVRQLMTNIFSPVSSDCSLFNLVLEVWFGPSLLLERSNEPKYLVDFVEAILDICPSNYEFAMSVCKLLSSHSNCNNVSSASMLFWASSSLVSAIFHCIPIPPEYVWVEAAGILGKIMGIEVIAERFYKRALSVYPFSVKLWKSYYILSMTIGNTNTVMEAAKERGIDLS
nr:uncharacterized protein LOC107413525 isoform X2 [Ziziphus jujuba var. spinosa]